MTLFENGVETLDEAALSKSQKARRPEADGQVLKEPEGRILATCPAGYSGTAETSGLFLRYLCPTLQSQCARDERRIRKLISPSVRNLF